MWSLSRPRSGRSGVRRGPVRARAALAALPALLAACNYGFTGGGGFPPDLRTMFVEPFENRTVQFELEQQIYRRLLDRVPRALGVRPAGRDAADALLVGTITGYDDAAQNYRPGEREGGTEVLAHQIQITVSVQLIDVKRNEILWEAQSLSAQGTYLPASQNEQVGRAAAIEQLAQRIIDGAQSQW